MLVAGGGKGDDQDTARLVGRRCEDPRDPEPQECVFCADSDRGGWRARGGAAGSGGGGGTGRGVDGLVVVVVVVVVVVGVLVATGALLVVVVADCARRRGRRRRGRPAGLGGRGRGRVLARAGGDERERRGLRSVGQIGPELAEVLVVAGAVAEVEQRVEVDERIVCRVIARDRSRAAPRRLGRLSSGARTSACPCRRCMPSTRVRWR